MKSQNSFILYHDMKSTLDMLDDAEMGKVMRAVFSYHDTGEIPELDRICNIAFASIKTTLDRDRGKWEDYKEKQSKNWKRGGRPKNEKQPVNSETQEKPNNPSLFQETQINPTEAKKADSVSVSDSATVTVSVSESVKNNSKELSDKSEITAYWNQDISKMLDSLSKSVWCHTFKETEKIQRGYWNHILTLLWKIGKEEFMERLKWILSDPFKRKNSNSIKYLYGELKSYIREGEWVKLKEDENRPKSYSF